MTTANDLPAQLALEIAALPAFTSYGNAMQVVTPIRYRYLTRLYSLAAAERLSDQFIHGIGADIGRQCDRAIALQARMQCTEKRWTSVPVSSLTEAERNELP